MQIDLHGRYPDEVPFYLNQAFSECRRRGDTQLTIIHGRGEGILKRAVMSELSAFNRKIAHIRRNDISVTLLLRDKPTSTSAYKRRSLKTAQPVDSIDYSEKVKDKRTRGREKYLKRMGRRSDS